MWNYCGNIVDKAFFDWRNQGMDLWALDFCATLISGNVGSGDFNLLWILLRLLIQTWSKSKVDLIMMTIVFLSPISKSNFHHLVFGILFKGGVLWSEKGRHSWCVTRLVEPIGREDNPLNSHQKSPTWTQNKILNCL